jgi:transcriptional regulator with GAF, ATPase, and Fis domain
MAEPRSMAERAIATGEVIVEGAAHENVRFHDGESMWTEGAIVLCVPIACRGRLEGAIYLDRSARAHAFTDASITMVRAIGHMLALALVTSMKMSDLDQRTGELEVIGGQVATSRQSWGSALSTPWPAAERRRSGVVPAFRAVELDEDGHELRADAIRRALRAATGHCGRAARMLGIARSTFCRYLELYGIDPSAFGVAGSQGSDE